ncbi:hypothetical protein KDA_11550 [Dictyobacter alpinus]|uniref:Uncharacterized protein n=1 Tax=Dictyobacter alpinus TaxID=2014873 RepID=A0A402B2U3_9CHLR|nr:hypothetical protein KDA_11550 [Dictyobacter alpinus]
MPLPRFTYDHAQARGCTCFVQHEYVFEGHFLRELEQGQALPLRELVAGASLAATWVVGIDGSKCIGHQLSH